MYAYIDKTSPNVAFEYSGDRNGEDHLKEIEVQEKKQLLDSTVTATLARSVLRNTYYSTFIIGYYYAVLKTITEEHC